MKIKFFAIITFVVLISAAAVAAPVKKKTAVKKTAKTEKLRVEMNLNQGKGTDSFKKGQEAFKNMWYDQAETYFKEALAQNPEDAYSTAYLGSIKLYNEDAQEAVDLLMSAIIMMDETTDPAFKAWTYSEMSAAYFELKQYDNALDFINQAVELSPADAHYAVERAVIKFRKRDYDGASMDAEYALTLSPEGDDLERAEGLVKACENILSGNNVVTPTEIIVAERDTVASDNVVMPEFPGGRKAMQEFIKTNVKYPSKSKKKGVGGTVVVECNFDPEGNMVASQVVEGINKELDDEALRVCQAMPKFSPGTIDGRPGHVKMLIQVKFNANK